MVINSLQNAQVKAWMKLHQSKYRQQSSMFIVEGEHLIEEAIKAQALEVLILKEGTLNPFNFDPTVELSEAVFHKLSQTVSMGSLMGVCRFKAAQRLEGQRFIICDRIQDPGNLGTLIRTALSFGFDQVILSKDCVDVTNDKVVRATQGALFQSSIVMMELKDAISQLKSQGVTVYGTGFNHAKHLSTVASTYPVALVLGNEGQGVQKDIIDLCDDTLLIEMSMFDSLNVAVAGSILAYHFRKG